MLVNGVDLIFLASRRGSTWGNWRLHQGRLEHTPSGYSIRLEQFHDAGVVLDWVLHVQQKSWLTDMDFRDFVQAVEHIVLEIRRLEKPA